MRTSERRRYPRYGFQSDVEIVTGSEVRKAFLTDLSMCGTFIVTDAPLWVGAAFSLRVLLNPPLELEGIVRRSLPGKGIGVEFRGVPEAARARLERMLAGLARG